MTEERLRGIAQQSEHGETQERLTGTSRKERRRIASPKFQRKRLASAFVGVLKKRPGQRGKFWRLAPILEVHVSRVVRP